MRLTESLRGLCARWGHGPRRRVALQQPPASPAKVMASLPFYDPGQLPSQEDPFPVLPGLMGIGGDLEPETLLEAYRRGVFPWYGEAEPILWWSPDPRAIFELDRFHVPRRLARTIRQGRYRVTIDQAFGEVIRGCAARPGPTWLTPEMIIAYEELHRLGYAHSVEVWQQEELAGGLYGVALGGLFAGESMFSRYRDASKIALVHVVERLRQHGFVLFDIQMLTPHTARFGALEIPRAEYLRRLRRALQHEAHFV